VTRDRTLGAIARDLFAPSEWWLRLHYGAGPKRSLTPLRWVRHPARVTYWFARRVIAYVRWNVLRARHARRPWQPLR
jgi:hypothetical protein